MTHTAHGTTPTTAPSQPSTNLLEARFDLESGSTQMSGMQALVRLPLDIRRLDERAGKASGVFISGYEGSPLAGFDLQLARQRERLAAHHVVFRPAVNEELGANAVQGSQLASGSSDRTRDGVAGIWYGKAPGLDRATDAIRHSNLGGTDRDGGVLALVGDDSTAKSSTVPSSSEPAIAELGMPCLAPADPQDILDLGRHGIAMSRYSGLWVAMKLATNVVDGMGEVSVDPDRVRPQAPNLTFGDTEFRHIVTGDLVQPTLGRLEATLVRERLEIARRYAAVNGLDRIVGDRDATIGIVCAGATYLDVREALVSIGITRDGLETSGVRILKLGMIHPIEPTIVSSFVAGLDEIVVVEEKRAFVELALKDLLYGVEGAPQIVGRRDRTGAELFRADSDLPADYIAERIAPLLRDRGSAEAAQWLDTRRSAQRMPTMLPILPRRPSFCSGCPHNSSTRVPDGSLVGAGIGCHGMVQFLPQERVGSSIGLAQMGGEGAAWAGMSPFVGIDHLFQNLGDGTYHHSGSLAVRMSVAAGTNITFKLLYNDAVAMTGGQQAIGKMSVPQIVAELLAEGVQRIVITSDDPKASRRQFGRGRLPRAVSIRHRDDLIAVQEKLAAIRGVTVLIHHQECATELRRKRKRGLVEAPAQRIVINERVCEGCGDCGDKSGCLSVQPVETEFGRKTRIHQASCNLDFSCIKGDCPSFIEVVPGGKVAGHETTPVSVEELPDPVLRVSPKDFAMRITGVGGTGVVTIAQVLAAAGARAGLHVKGLDQLGLAQKGGAVVSDVRFSTEEIDGTNKIGPGGADLYLGCDVLVAAAEPNLAVIAPDRTFAVVSTSETPTGAMVTDTNVHFPDRDTLVQRIEWAGSRAENVFVDVREALRGSLGDDQYSNVFLLGAAVQAGVLPIAPEHVEWALDLNGVQVKRNLQAFRRGRKWVADREAIEAAASDRSARAERHHGEASAVAEAVRVLPGSALHALLHGRVAELIDYQNVAYARRYAEAVESIRAAESDALEGSIAVTEEYARNLFKVMAYKDEYEVARLHVDASVGKQLRDQFGAGATYSFLLHPPVLRALGMKRKIRLNARWARFVLSALYRVRGLRGTRADVFGYAHVRREERALIADYSRAVDAAVGALSTETLATVLEVAALPDIVRGYEDIKLRNLERYRVRRDELLAKLQDS